MTSPRSPVSAGHATTSSATSREAATMRISDLMACKVYDHDGHCLGRVRDVRLVMDGPLRGTNAMLRVDGVIVGGNALAGRLGYLRGGVRGPALLAAPLRRLE